MSGEHVAPRHEIDDPNKPRRERHTPPGIIRRPVAEPPMVPIKDTDEPGGYDEAIRELEAEEDEHPDFFDSDEDYEADERLGDELAKLEEQIG